MPNGRYTTRSAQFTNSNTLSFTTIFSQPGPWSVRLTLSDGRQSPPFHFTVLPTEAAPVEISGLTRPDFALGAQTFTFTGQGLQALQSNLQLQLRFPGGESSLPSSAIQNITPNSFDLRIDLQSILTFDALRQLNQVPQAVDPYDTRARWDSDLSSQRSRIVATGALAEATDAAEALSEVGIYLPPVDFVPTDLALGYDGILYVALYNASNDTGQLVMVDRRDRWQPFSVPLPANFHPWRLAPHPEGGVWALDRLPQPIEDAQPRQLVRVQGEPLPTQAQQAFTPDTFRPCEENPNPPHAQVLWQGQFPDEISVGIATSPTGKLALLSWTPGSHAHLRLWNSQPTASDPWQRPFILIETERPFSFKWINEDAVAFLLPGLATEAVVYDLTHFSEDAHNNNDSPILLSPNGKTYPLRNHTSGPFLNGITSPPSYATIDGHRTLHALSTGTFATQGTTQPVKIDSHNTQTVWHRLYLEAILPARTGIRIFLAATDTADISDIDEQDWYEHRFGQRYAPGTQFRNDPPYNRQIPLGAWVSQPSEVPHHQGLLGCGIEQNRQGLFTALIQRSGRQVRALQGRYLWIRAELNGDGHRTPEIAALRTYGSRFSYLNEYLPALYRETQFGPDANAPGTSTPADFLERFLGNFEGLLTPLEDRIARADLLTDPRTVPEESLDWLGSWVGLSFDTAISPQRRRQIIQAAPQLHRQHGTLLGLQQALDLATGGSVTGGEIVVLEDFRLRRTFATILGVNLGGRYNPLTAGYSSSGNSFVGDTLVLGEEQEREFLSLFSVDRQRDFGESDQDAIKDFFDQLAHRVTVYVHNDVNTQELGLINRIVALESPAHVRTTVVTTSAPLLVSLSAQIGLDTYLRPVRSRNRVTVGESPLGIHDTLQQVPSLDPRLSGGVQDLRAPRARARVDGPPPLLGESFFLDGSRSEAFGNQEIDRYIWTRTDRDGPPPEPP
ncbi:MAG: phage tail protein [Cyanobacteria bacterium J06576_12]